MSFIKLNICVKWEWIVLFYLYGLHGGRKFWNEQLNLMYIIFHPPGNKHTQALHLPLDINQQWSDIDNCI